LQADPRDVKPPKDKPHGPQNYARKNKRRRRKNPKTEPTEKLKSSLESHTNTLKSLSSRKQR